MNKQKGFTVIELLAAFMIIFSLVCACSIAYVAYHFILKFW